MKKILPVDEDLLRVSRAYVNAQLEIMGRYESRPDLTPEAVEELAIKCAQAPQGMRNKSTKGKPRRDQ